MSLLPINLAQLPARLAAGVYIAHSGIDKWNGDDATAEAVHGMAVGTYPFLAKLGPRRFLRLLAAGEIAVGAAVALPIVPTRTAGAALSAFSTALLGLYARTPGMRKPGSIWPTQQGIGISQDIWLLGIGISLLTQTATPHTSTRSA